MGAQVSTQVATQTTTVVNRAMTNMVNKSTTSASAVNVNTNQIDLDLTGANIEGCDLDFNQMISATQSVKCMAKFQSVADMQSQLKAALQNEAKQASQAEQQALSLSVGVATGVSDVNQAISNYVETNITNETLNEVNSHLANQNGIEIKAKGLKMKCTKGQGKFVINQGIISQQTAEMLSDAVIGNKLSTETDSDAKARLDQEAKLKATGIQGVFSAIGLTIMLPLIICVAIIAIFLGPSLISGMGKGGGMKMMKMVKFGKQFKFGFGGRR